MPIIVRIRWFRNFEAIAELFNSFVLAASRAQFVTQVRV